MKEYYGYPASGEVPAQIGYRSRGSGPASLIIHTTSDEYPTVEWGVVNVPANNLSRSILLDAFGTNTCEESPKKCLCTNKWVTDSVVEEFAQKIVATKFIKDGIFKISQLEVCDFVFEALENATEESEINLDIELEPIPIMEPELI